MPRGAILGKARVFLQKDLRKITNKTTTVERLYLFIHIILLHYMLIYLRLQYKTWLICVILLILASQTFFLIIWIFYLLFLVFYLIFPLSFPYRDITVYFFLQTSFIAPFVHPYSHIERLLCIEKRLIVCNSTLFIG
jgi:hypothetical protein